MKIVDYVLDDRWGRMESCPSHLCDMWIICEQKFKKMLYTQSIFNILLAEAAIGNDSDSLEEIE